MANMSERSEARRYLLQIRRLEEMIGQKQTQLAELEEMATSGGAIRYDKDKVVTQLRTDTLENRVIRYVDLTAEIQQNIRDYLSLKNSIINEIHQLEDVRYITILHDYYVDDRDMMEIALKLGYSYYHTVRLNREALEEFWRKHNAKR